MTGERQLRTGSEDPDLAPLRFVHENRLGETKLRRYALAVGLRDISTPQENSERVAAGPAVSDEHF